MNPTFASNILDMLENPGASGASGANLVVPPPAKIGADGGMNYDGPNTPEKEDTGKAKAKEDPPPPKKKQRTQKPEARPYNNNP